MLHACAHREEARPAAKADGRGRAGRPFCKGFLRAAPPGPP